MKESSSNKQNNSSAIDTSNVLDSLAEPSYQKQQDHQDMNQPITLYYKNVTEEIVGSDHGLSASALDELAAPMAKITEAMASARESGNLAYRDLPYQSATIEKITALAEQLRPTCDNLVVLGIGGSALGNIALQTALNSATYNLLDNDQRSGNPRLFVIDNVDPDQLSAILDFLDGQLDRTLFNVISKSGRTAETAAHFLTICEMLKNKLGPESLKDRIVATTDTTSGTLRSIVDREGFTALEVPDGVGGRFSVLSDVGLFSAAMCGIDIKELLAGATAMDERVKTSDLKANPAALYAAIQYSYYKMGKPLSVMMPYSYQLKDLSDWFRQLWAESLGKQTDLDGKEVFVGPTPINALGTTDQHSQVQLYREGPNDKIFTFLEVEKFGTEVIIGDAGETTELSYLSGRKMSDLMNAEKQGTEYALLKSNRPCLTIKFPAINAHTVGQFIYLLEVATSYFAGLLNINTYDQPAVELGKEATFALMGHSEWTDLLKEIETTTQIDSDYLL